MIAAALLSASTSASLKSSAAMTTMSSTTTTTTTTSMKTTEQQVRTLIPVTTADGSKLFVSGPCIVLKTQTPAPTVAQQVQALRPLLKADINSNKKAGQGQEKKPNDRNNNNNNNTNINEQIKNITTATSAVSKKSSTNSNVENEPEPLRCKRRIDFTSLGLPRPQPAAMARRNERERNRVKQVNLGFETLRQHVPQGRKNKKLSKVDTLKEAVKYIKYLHQVLMETEDDADSTALTDTITMVSRSSPITTTSSPKAESVITPAQTSSTATASTNTSDVTTMDFSCDSTPNVMGSGPADFHVNSSSVFKLDPELSDCSPDELKHFGQLTHVHDFNNMPQPHHHPANTAEAVKNASSDHFLDLTPAQIRFSHAEQSTPSPMDVEPMGVSTHPGTDLAPLPTIFTASSSSSSSASSAVTFMNFIPSSTDSSRLDIPPTRLGPDRQSFRVAEQGCRGGSEGSCPVSPSQSSGASDESPGEEYLGVPGCEPWQDLSADIAEWLCSKIDIDDPDVFV